MTETTTQEDIHIRHEREWQALKPKPEPVRISLVRPPRLEAQPELDRGLSRDH